MFLIEDIVTKISQIWWKIQILVTIVAILKTKDKKQILGATTEKWHLTYKRIKINSSPLRNYDARKE